MSSENPKHCFYSHHVPLDSLEPSLAHRPPDREIIAYFRDRCILSLCKHCGRTDSSTAARKNELPSEGDRGIAGTGMYAIADSL